MSCVIHTDPKRVYDFASRPKNLSLWAHGLAEDEVRYDGDDLVVSSPMGEVRVRFVPSNDLGVIDHDVILPTGETVTNPLRVIAHPSGAEVVFTIRQRGMSDEDFERDCRAVREDLGRLKAIIES
ncbi:SRPBCC family protein [Corynebacterium tapiri]|uniref:SRPBCC family protein n=1 Tax=Corynebacterium tapiri TaxID=1448266 RepID=A0A5C4U7Y5_9CORY|nr:SRPBCC family protein [Corynebacterium tapiri]